MAENSRDEKGGEAYNPLEAELRIMALWDSFGIYKFDAKSENEIFSVDTPPPTVSGKMHIGHAFSYVQQDFLVRYRRMRGFNVFYPFGTDDNGLPTERLIEKIKGVIARDMPRDEFVKLCLTTVQNELIPEYLSDWKRIGISCDFSILYSTINEHCRRISQRSFIELYKKGREYRRDAPAMWCPECQTGISQVECQDKELESSFNNIVFEIGNKTFEIATTRPELLPACVAVLYNPDDERYKGLEGKKAIVPLFNLDVPVIADRRVDPGKGTGIVMCCTFGDQTDMDWQRAYNLPIREAISPGGKMTKLARKYAGMGIKEARKAIISNLKRSSLLTKELNIKHYVKVHERCGTEIEFIKSKQWFIKYLDLKDEMLKWGNEMNWYPEHMRYRYENWVQGLQWDWLISRQRFFGIPFPVWYCKRCDEVILADEDSLPVDPLKDKAPVSNCPKCQSAEFIPETDILDTWTTSALTPTITREMMPSEIQRKLDIFSLRPQAHDIITFWLFNTVVKSQLHYGRLPFKDIMISGFVTLGGEKMSKSKGNIVEPQVIAGKYGADALRYWAAGSKLGEDLNYQEKDVITGKKFITKIWNATKFVFGKMEHKEKAELVEMDRLFFGQLNALIKSATESFEKYEYSVVKREVDLFFWKMLCDNYLEIVKNRVYQGSDSSKSSAYYTLYNSLLTILKLIAPITPFITEEIYQTHYRNTEKEKSIHIASWPKAFDVEEKREDNEKFKLILDIIARARQIKTKERKSMKASIILQIEKDKMNLLSDVMDDLKSVVNASEVREGNFEIRLA